MHQSSGVASDTIVRTTARTIITSGVIFVVGLYLIAFFMNRQAAFPSISLESENAVYTITRTDGSVETYSQNHFPLVTYGDTLTCEVEPLGDAVSSIQNGTLVFSLYHSYVKVYCGDTLLYAQDEPAEGKMIGHRYYIIPLPEGYEMQTITIIAACAEHDTFNSLIEPKIIPADRAAYAFRSGNFATGILLITLLIGAIFMEFSSAVSWLFEHRSNGLLSISFLCSAICLWYMGFSGSMQPFVENNTFLAVVEYVGLYLSAIALSFFLQNHTTSRKLKLFCLAETLFLCGFFILVSYLTVSAPGISYVDFIGLLRGILLLTLVILLISEVAERNAKRDLGEATLHYGCRIVMVLAALELTRFILAQYLSATIPWITTSLTPVCILALVFTALMYYGVQVSENQYRRIEEENLKKLAYLDQLTGAPNRAACYERLDQMRRDHVTDYVVTFIDINFLKKTNDTWGHDKGDELIRTASDLLEKYFTGEDFFGRWGGDEFIAVHFGTLDETCTIMDRIQKEMDERNRSGKYDFLLSEAWGFGESTKENPRDPDEAIRLADEQMYVEKQKAHAARQ